jgi:hypothetical protein
MSLVAAAFLAGGLASLASCTSDVILGGSFAEAGSPDGDDGAASPELVDICEPCSTSKGCPTTARCVQIAGNLTFCATACPKGNECASDETCTALPPGPTSDAVRACVPSSGACTPAKPPQNESATPERCGVLSGPTTAAECRSCDVENLGCQPNGCYGGWWCNTTTDRCERPPAICP